MTKQKPIKKKGDLRRDWYGTWHIVTRSGRDEYFLGRLQEGVFERLMNGEKIRCDIIHGLLYKKGKKIWLEKDLDKELGRTEWVWVLTLKDNQNNLIEHLVN